MNLISLLKIRGCSCPDTPASISSNTSGVPNNQSVLSGDDGQHINTTAPQSSTTTTASASTTAPESSTTTTASAGATAPESSITTTASASTTAPESSTTTTAYASATAPESSTSTTTAPRSSNATTSVTGLSVLLGAKRKRKRNHLKWKRHSEM